MSYAKADLSTHTRTRINGRSFVFEVESRYIIAKAENHAGDENFISSLIRKMENNLKNL